MSQTVTKHATTERKEELDKAKGMVQSWKASYEGNSLVGAKAVVVTRWVCRESKEGASLAKLKIFALKSHDWHIWFERVMSVMLHGFIPKDEWLVLAELSYFFHVLCAKELSPGLLDEMEQLAPELIASQR